MIVVADTSCICYLARLGLGNLLPKLFGDVIIPATVEQELRVGAKKHDEIVDVLKAGWLKTRMVEDPEAVDRLPRKVDVGEAEAVVLAKELGAILLVDDIAGRICAEELGVRITGSFGVLLTARRQGKIGPLRPYVETLVEKFEFRASPQLMRKVLESAGE